MHDQPRYKPLAGTGFFGDGRSARPAVEGTVARGQLRIDTARFTGKLDGQDVDEFPFQITKDDLQRGQQRFDIYCSPCHSRIGDGNGELSAGAFGKPRLITRDKLIKAPIGHFFDVITNGFGAMPSYGSRVEPDDRWRIAACISGSAAQRECQNRRCARGTSLRSRGRPMSSRYDSTGAQLSRWQALIHC